MKVECRIAAKYEENPHAEICVGKMSPAIAEAIAILEAEGSHQNVVMGHSDDRIYFLEPAVLELVRTEGREVAAYDQGKKRYVLRATLQDLERLLGHDFVRVSKSSIVNIRRIRHVAASFNGTMELVTKNGMEDYISRSFRKAFKERLGL